MSEDDKDPKAQDLYSKFRSVSLGFLLHIFLNFIPAKLFKFDTKLKSTSSFFMLKKI
jgi:hypothetical protein